MRVTELRIGNWLQRLDGSVFQITCDDLKIINEIAEKLHPQPIPLTEEWLLKFRFEKDDIAYSKNIDLFGGGKKLSFSGDYLYIVDSEKQNTIPTDIITIWNKDVKKNFYVHQLQNLYFALTGEELTLKEQ